MSGDLNLQKEEYENTTQLSDCLTVFPSNSNEPRTTRVAAQRANTVGCDADNGLFHVGESANAVCG